LRAARSSGAVVIDGLWMLVFQGLAAWRNFTATQAPLPASWVHANLVRELYETAELLDDVRLEFQRNRAIIDATDEEIIRLLALRFRAARRIGQAKAALGEPVVRPERERLLLAMHERVARACGIDVRLVYRIFEEVLGASRREQSRLIAGANAEGTIISSAPQASATGKTGEERDS
jgi:chorismate mutase